MAINANKNSRLFISPTPVVPDTINAMSDGDAITFFQAINDWIEVEEIEDLGTAGDTSEAIPFTAINNSRVRKLKGPRDAGTQSVVVGRDPLDDGQEALIAAEATDYNYAFKLVLNDARSPQHSKSEMYYAGMVMSKATNLGNVSNVVRRNFDIGINTGVFEQLSDSLVAPANVVPPSIVTTGADTFMANEGVWSNDPTSFAYLWEEDDTGWTAITGTSTTKTVTYTGSNDLRVTVTASNGAGAGTPAVSLVVTPPA